MKKPDISISLSPGDLKQPFFFLFELIRILAGGLYRVFLEVYNPAGNIMKSVPRPVYFFSALNLLLFAVAFLPWVQYSITLIDKETLRIGSDSKLWFLLPGFLGILLSLTDIPSRKAVYLVFLMIAAAFYILGFLFPGTIHVKFRSEGDYGFTVFYYIYGPFLAAALAAILLSSPFEKPVFRMIHWLFSKNHDVHPVPKTALFREEHSPKVKKPTTRARGSASGKKSLTEISDDLKKSAALAEQAAKKSPPSRSETGTVPRAIKKKQRSPARP